jgi:hypothetical protein
MVNTSSVIAREKQMANIYVQSMNVMVHFNINISVYINICESPPFGICVICENCEFISIGISFELGFSSVPIDPQACGTTSILRLINFHYVQLHHAMCQKIHITLINWIKIRVRGW